MTTAAPATPPSLAPSDAKPRPAAGAVLILGATSAIARAVAEQFARAGQPLVLAGREADEIAAIASDLHWRYGVRAVPMRFDALDFDAHPRFFDEAAAAVEGGLAGVVLLYGLLGDQAQTQSDRDLCRRTIDVNFTSAVSMLELAAAYFQQRRATEPKAPPGFICAVSSVAGDRGRQSNYIYGAAKGGLTVYLQGLRNRLFRDGIPVVTVKPGFVDTSMTWGLLKPGSPLTATPQKVAGDIVKAIRRRKNVIYTPFFWRGIMGIIKRIPEPIFKRLKL